MARKPSSKKKKKAEGLNSGQKKQLISLLKKSGLSESEILKAVPKISKMISLGTSSSAEIIQEFIADYSEKKATEALKDLERKSKEEERKYEEWLKKNASAPPRSERPPSTPSGTPPAPTETGTGKPSPIDKTKEQIGLLDAIIKQRSEMGMSTTDLEKIVIGMEGNVGIRKQLQQYVDANLTKFDRTDPAGAAAAELFTETAKLSENALDASREEAARIYEKLKFIRELAKKTQGEQSDVAKKLQEVIEPVEKQLQKQTSFREFLKDRISDFRKTLPERLVSKIPLVGGIFADFLREKRSRKEELEKFSGGMQRDIARGGTRPDLFFDGVPRKTSLVPTTAVGEETTPTGDGTSAAMTAIGGTPASKIPGLLSSPDTTQTLGGIYSEITKIRELLIDRFSPSSEGLRRREEELEAGKPKGAVSGTETEKTKLQGGLKNFVSDLMSGGWKKALKKTKIGKGLRKLRVFGKRTLPSLLGSMKKSKIMRRGKALTRLYSGRAKKMLGRSRLFRAARIGKKLLTRKGIPLARKAMGAVRNFGGGLVDKIKSTSLGARAIDTAKSIGGKAMEFGGKIFRGLGGQQATAPVAALAPSASGVKAAVGAAGVETGASALSSASTAAAKPTGGFFSRMMGGAKNLVSKAGEKLGSLKGLVGGAGGLGKMVMGALGPVLESFFAWQDIDSIKGQSNLSPQEKKKQIGMRVGQAIGSVAGTIGLGAALGPAGSMISAALDTFGIGPGALGSWLVEKLGGEKVYDLAASVIPALTVPEKEEATGQTGKEIPTTGEVSKGTPSTSNIAEVEGTVSIPSSPNTSLGRMMGAYSAEMNALEDAKAESLSPRNPTNTNNSVVNAKVTNTTNNFNDDLRIRNNEPTLKQAQMMIMTTW